MSKHRRKQLWEEPETASEADEVPTGENEVGEDAERPEENSEGLPEGADEALATASQIAAVRAEIEQLRAALAAMQERAKVESVNDKNGRQSTGKLEQKGDEGYFSPDEVRAMSREAVRANYDGIVRSMKHWR